MNEKQKKEVFQSIKIINQINQKRGLDIVKESVRR
jgi:hypothetical protein